MYLIRERNGREIGYLEHIVNNSVEIEGSISEVVVPGGEAYEVVGSYAHFFKERREAVTGNC